MNRHVNRGLLVGVLALGLSGVATSAFAQNGSLKGKVVTEDGKPAANVEVVFDFVGEIKRQVKTITDKNGEWIKPGLPAGGGTWTISARQGKTSGTLPGVVIKINETQKVADIVLVSEETRASGKKVVSNDEAAKANKAAAEIEALAKEINAAVDAGNYDEALTKLKGLDGKLEKCAQCQMKIGEILIKKKDDAGAEAALLKAIEYDPAATNAYVNLANIYNGQRKFEEAAKMSAKANELMAAGGGGGDALSFINQGIIFWNAGKYPEAKAEFAKAVKADPKKPEGQYWLGLSTYNLASTGVGTLADAKGPLSEYLKLAPSGEYAEVVKALLATIK
jgi:tetratricopeptide (TPR) repeat protein